jgi:hypothetical protein
VQRVAQPSPAASCRSVSLRDTHSGLAARGETLLKPAGVDARTQLSPDALKNNFRRCPAGRKFHFLLDIFLEMEIDRLNQEKRA